VPGVSQIEATLKPAGVEHAIGAMTSVYLKDPDDPIWEKDPAVQEYYTFMKQWAPREPAGEASTVFGYIAAAVMVDIFKRCGDDLTRENLMDKATHIKNLQLPLFIPGVLINITPEHRLPWKQAQMARFNGKSWVFVGGIVSAPGEE